MKDFNWKKSLISVLSVIGILLSIELIIVYFNVNFITGAAPSFCAINDTINCDSVARTPFSHFLGLPLALYGFGFYLVILALSFAQELKSLPLFNALKNPQSCIFSLALVSLIGDVSLAVISTQVIHKICVLCFITYGVNFLLVPLSKGAFSIFRNIKNAFIDLISLFSSRSNAILTCVIAFMVVSFIGFANFTGVFLGANKGADHSSVPAGNLLGSAKPQVTIDEYTDYECPYCSISNVYMKRLVDELDYVQVNHHDYPLSSQCNPSLNAVIHKDACRAALYARAAKKQGKFWEMASALFDNQYNLSEPMILSLGQSMNLDVKELKKDAKDPMELSKLKEDAAAAAKLGVNATPTYYIKAKGKTKRIEGLMSYPDFKKTVEGMLK